MEKIRDEENKEEEEEALVVEDWALPWCRCEVCEKARKEVEDESA